MVKASFAGLFLALAGGVLAVCPPLADSYTTVKLAALGAGGALAWLALTVRGPRCTALDAPLAALWAAMLLAAAFSVDPAISVLGAYPQAFYGLLPLGLCTALYYAAAAGGDETGESLQNAGLAVCIPLALFAIWQRVYGDPVTHQPLPSGHRVTSTIGNPVMLGACLVMLCPLALHRTLTRRRPVLGPVCLVLIAAALALTISRGAWLCAALSAGAYLWLTGRIKPKPWQWAALALAVPLAFWGMQRVLNKRSSDSLRAETTKTGLAAFAARPLTGWGPDAFMIAFRRHKTEEFLRVSHNSPTIQYSAHNDVLQAAATLGLPGLLAYLWLLWALGRRLYASSRTSARAAATAAAFAGLFVQAKFNPVPISVLALAALLAGFEAREKRTPRPATGRIVAVLAAVFCAACAGLYGRLGYADYLFRRGGELVNTAELDQPAYMEGVNDLRRACELNPWSVEYLLQRSNNLFRILPFIPEEQAKQLLEKSRDLTADAVRRHPGNPMAHELRATALALSWKRFKTDTLREAQAEIKLAVEQDPTFTFSLRRLMDIDRALGDREDFESTKAQYIRVSEISQERAEWKPLL